MYTLRDRVGEQFAQPGRPLVGRFVAGGRVGAQRCGQGRGPGAATGLERVEVVGGEAGAVFDGVDADRDQPGRDVGDAVRGHSHVALVRGFDDRGDGVLVVGPGRAAAGDSAAVGEVREVGDQFDPAGAVVDLPDDGVDEFGFGHRFVRAREVAAFWSKEPAGRLHDRAPGDIGQAQRDRTVATDIADQSDAVAGQLGEALRGELGPGRAGDRLRRATTVRWQWASTRPGSAKRPGRALRSPAEPIASSPSVPVGEHACRETPTPSWFDPATIVIAAGPKRVTQRLTSRTAPRSAEVAIRA